MSMTQAVATDFRTYSAIEAAGKEIMCGSRHAG
jgi:hypothetical protein